LGAPGGRAAINAIEGMAGLGKTTLAVHVAHRHDAILTTTKGAARQPLVDGSE
jgi:deoxyadenosine/deoxycytidine kinase